MEPDAECDEGCERETGRLTAAPADSHEHEETCRRGEDHQIYTAISTGRNTGMITMEQSLAELVRTGRISREVAMTHCFRPQDFERYHD